MKKIFTPLQIIDAKTFATLVIVQLAIALGFWQILGGELLPTPSKVIAAVFTTIASPSFFDDFFSSLGLTLQGMGISIFIALIVSYLSLVPVFKPLAEFIVKCRYLTLTGLIFVFTLYTKDGHQLKISLLIFGIVPFFVTSFLSVIASINSQEFELCKTLRMSNWRTLLEVVIIGKLDQVLEVLRQNFAIAWMMITMVEGLSMSEGGLGTMLIKSSKYINMANVFAVLLIIFMIGVLFDYLLGKMRHWLFPYTKINIR
jgi:ABC-type nitrate/sulfonate/bicarbonate transport system permease component